LGEHVPPEVDWDVEVYEESRSDFSDVDWEVPEEKTAAPVRSEDDIIMEKIRDTYRSYLAEKSMDTPELTIDQIVEMAKLDPNVGNKRYGTIQRKLGFASRRTAKGMVYKITRGSLWVS
jgi:uncharacterized protein YajQ (UPF0234 family)